MMLTPTRLFTVLILVLTSTVAADWPKFAGNLGNTGVIKMDVSNDFSFDSMRIKWVFYAGDSIRGSPVVADLDGDGLAEVLVGSGDGRVYALDYVGRPLWSFRTNGSIVSTPAVSDVDGDGLLEVAVGSCDGVLYLLDYRGGLVWRYVTGGQITGSPAIADLEGNGRGEIVFASWDKNLYVLDSGGRRLKSFPTTGWSESSPAVADLNGDGLLDVVFGSNDKAVHVMLARGSVVSFLGHANFISSPTVVGDEVIACSEDGVVYRLFLSRNVEAGGRGVYQMRARWNRSVGGGIISSAGVADLISDPGCEVLVGSVDRNMYVFSGDGRLLLPYSTSGKIVSQPAILDSGEGFLIIFTTVDGELFVLNSSFSAVWRYDVGERIVSSPAVSDVEGDGFPEIVVATEGGSVYVFGVDSLVGGVAETTTTSTTSTSVVSTSSTSSSSSTTSTAIVPGEVTSSTVVVASGGGAPVGGVAGLSVGDAGLFLFPVLLLVLFFYCVVGYRG